MGIPIVAGRAFNAQDTATSAKVVIINQSLAHKRFPNLTAIGKQIRDGDVPESFAGRIVGICADTRYSLRDEPPPQFFMLNRQQSDVGGLTYALRSSLEPAALAPALREAVRKIDRDLPIVDIRTQQGQIDSTMQKERIFASLTAGFGLLALALACVGIDGSMAYSGANRSNEIGIRVALGAQPRQVRGMILGESTWLAVVGIVVGVGAALLLTRLVKSMLYAMQPYDPTTMTAVILVLLALALAASWIPARRAAGVQPNGGVALRIKTEIGGRRLEDREGSTFGLCQISARSSSALAGSFEIPESRLDHRNEPANQLMSISSRGPGGRREPRINIRESRHRRSFCPQSSELQ